MRITRHELNMQVAEVISQRSTCKRKKVGAVLTKDNRIIATGYNGVPSKVKHCEECIGPNCGRVIHAEAGLISFCAKHGIATEGSTLYITMLPCKECAKLIINAGIKTVIYKEEYRALDGLKMLIKADVNIIDLGSIKNYNIGGQYDE